MDNMQILFSQLFMAKEDGRSTTRVFVSEPTPLEEKNLGRFFAICEIESADTANEEIINLLINEISKNYYRSNSFEITAAFENSLQKLNQKLQKVVSEIGENWLSSTNIILGINHNHQIIFTPLGKVIAFMVYRHNLIDIVDTTKSKAQEINPLKIFSNTLTGEIPTNATVFFATERILDYLSREKLKQILAKQVPEEAVNELSELLAEDTSNTNFAAIIMQLKAHQISAEEIPVVNQPHAIAPAKNKEDSMKALVHKEQKTEEFLTSSIWPSIKKGIQRSVQSIRQKTDQEKLLAPEKQTDDESKLATTSFAARRTTSNSKLKRMVKILLSAVSSLAKGTIKSIGRGITYLKDRKKNTYSGGSRGPYSSAVKGKRRKLGRQRSVVGVIGQTIARLLRWFLSLTTLQKTFFVVAIVVLLIFAQSVVNRGEEKISKSEEQQYEQTVIEIDKKINEAKAASLYDSSKARTLFLQARDLLAQIPKETDVYQKRGEEISQNVTTQLKAVNNVITVDQPALALDFTAINPGIKVQKMILLGASIYGFDQNTLSVYRGNLENKGATLTMSEQASAKSFRAVTKASPGTGLVSFSDQTMAIFNPITETLSPLELAYNDGKHNIADLVVYGVRLYTLDTLQNQIFRHQRSGDEFSAAEKWLAEGAETLANTVSMAIDGNIYVLKNNGKLIRFTAGQKDNDFKLETIDPALTSGDVVITDENTQNLYILDASNKRVAIFNKDGAFVAQYTSEEFTDLKDLIVDEVNKRFYILNNSKVYEIQLQDVKAPEARDETQ